SIVFSRIGQVVPNAMKAISDWVPRLKAMVNTVTNATAGRDRPKCRNGSREPAAAAERPSAIPSGTPTAIAIASPPHTRPRLGRMLLVAPRVSSRGVAGQGEAKDTLRATIAH